MTCLDLLSRGLGHTLQVPAGSPRDPGRAGGEVGGHGEEATAPREISVQLGETERLARGIDESQAEQEGTGL